ncbi:sulfonate ABC transporter substrate-binding protein [Paenibacillus sp. SC116]|uniref:sulfonate ABC transporter substrate-binding protein n=1 Tax=Paenibacillus sp. SC116 TaxID=2968986 RepID=UPI00215A74EB|nr:sulfonate ABC transporter substrate-binding protein [Paenibacillus sp. SC116]MCR8844636.1 sulfonate ABC transporter substrate-binding protein [Paenibacillus sp. SC116]
MLLKTIRTWKLIAIGALLLMVLSGCSGGVQQQNAVAEGKNGSKAKVFRIGYQKYGVPNFLKVRGGLEKRLEQDGVTVEWTEFPGGPQLLEALNVGSIDLGHTGEAPPIFAQAAGAPLVYLAHEASRPHSEAVLVLKDSPVQSIADLKGKKIALNKGSNVHYLLVKLLEQAGLQYSDVKPVFLPPADARAAFERGSVDAWAIWDPYLASAQKNLDVRIVADGEGVVNNFEFYLAARSFAENNPAIIDALFEELNKAGDWANANHKELAKLLSPQLGIDIPSLELASSRREYNSVPISDNVVAEQQKVADTFAKLGLIPKPIQVKDALPNHK